MGQDEKHYDSIAQLASQLRAGRLGAVELTKALLDRIDKLNPHLGAFKLVTRQRAVAEAKAAELELRSGRDLGPLHGIPYVVKDIYDVKGFPTGAGCRLLEEVVAPDDCTVVRRLSAAGGVLLGKTHTVQFACGAVGINHDTGTPHNPWHRVAHAPGGSSSGTAVAIASRLAPMGLGSDTGGSVRIPSALCGTVGLKTTVGRVSRHGVYPLSGTLDSVGPLARCVEDAAIAYQAMQGVDLRDDSTAGVPRHDALAGLRHDVKDLRIAFSQTLFFEDVDAEVQEAVRRSGDVFESLGAHVGEIELPELTEVLNDDARALLIPAEAYVHNRKLLEDHFADLDPIVAERMIRGKQLPAWQYYGFIRKLASLRQNLAERLRDVDAVLAPTTMIPAAPLDVIDTDTDSYLDYNYKYMRNTSVGNLLNLCGLSVPCGFTKGGLPIGLMIYAKPFEEAMALRVAWAYEQATDWHTRRPDLSWVGQ